MTFAQGGIRRGYLALLVGSYVGCPLAAQGLEVTSSEGSISAYAGGSLQTEVDSHDFTSLISEASGVLADVTEGSFNAHAFTFGTQVFSGFRILLDAGSTAFATPYGDCCPPVTSTGQAGLTAWFTVPPGQEAGVTGVVLFTYLYSSEPGPYGSAQASVMSSSGDRIATAFDWDLGSLGYPDSFSTVIGPGSYSVGVYINASTTKSPGVDSSGTLWVYAKSFTGALTEGPGTHAAAFSGASEAGGLEITASVSS